MEGKAGAQELRSNEFIYGVMPADVLANAQQVSERSNNAAACKPPVS